VFERGGGLPQQTTAGSRHDGNRRRPLGVRRFVTAGSVALAVVVIDQLTKSWAVRRLSHGDIHVVWKLDLELTYNSGASFGFARGWAPIIAAVAVTAVVLLLSAVRHVRSVALTVALGLVIGGALGNLTDRVVRGHHGAVVDFIALHFWPTFNVADSCIVIGALAAALLLSRRDAPAAAAPSVTRSTVTGDAGPGGAGEAGATP